MAGPPRIVYLDVDDEITSAAARIRTADSPRVAIVVPPGSRVSTSRINFRLLAREALASGRQLSIVAPDAASRSLAAAAGLDVYRTVGEFETADAEGRADGHPGGGAAAGAAMASAAAAGSSGASGSGPTGAETVPVEGGTPPAGGRPEAGSPSRTAEPGATRAAVAGAAMAGAATGGAGAAGNAGPLAPASGVGASPDDLRPRSNVAGVRSVAPASTGRPVRRILLGGTALVVVALLVVAAVAAYLLLPQATIVVVPKVEPVGPIQTNVTADPSATSVDLTNGIVPAQKVSFPVQANGTFKATGQNVTETKATGTVTFTSQNTLFDVTVPAGTDISTGSGVHFLTAQDVVVPKASFATGPTSVNVGVTALKPGTSGNVPANTITSEPMTLTAALISVNNAQPTSGGTHVVTPKVAQKDVDGAVASLQKQLGDTFKQQMASGTNVPAGLTLFPETGSLGAATMNPDPASLVGQQVAQFTLAASATGTATAVDEAPVTSVAEARLRAEVPAGYDLVPGSISITTGTPTVNGALVTFPTTATASQTKQLDAAQLEAEVRGLPVDQAKEVLGKYGMVTITTWPDWVSSIPTYDFRVELTVQPVPSPAPSSTAPASSPPTSPASSGSSAPQSAAPPSPSPS